MAQRSASFARINRRQYDLFNDFIEERNFTDDLFLLVNSHTTSAIIDGRRWFAGDFEVESSETFVTGVLGYEDEEVFVSFDAESNSWEKGETSEVSGSTAKTRVPFAIDARDDKRYVGSAACGGDN